MATISMRLMTTAKFRLAAALIAASAGGAAWAQGVVVVEDYETGSPAADVGPPLPTLGSRPRVSTNNGMSGMNVHPSASPSRNQAMMNGVPQEMLSEGHEMQAEPEAKTGILSRLPRLRMPRLFADDSQEQPAVQEQARRAPYATAPQATAEQSTYRGPRRLARQTGPQSIGMSSQPEPRAKQPPRAPSWSLKNLFGSGEETEEALPTIGDGASLPAYEGRAFQGPSQGSPAARSAPVPSNNRFSNQQPPNANPRRDMMSGALPSQMQTAAAQSNQAQEGNVEQVGYTQRGNGGMQLRPSNNRPASLFGGSMNSSMNSPSQSNASTSGGTVRMQPGTRPDAFSNGPQTLERLSQNRHPQSEAMKLQQPPTPTAPNSQPVFVSDDANMPKPMGSSLASNDFRAPQNSRPLISSVSPEAPFKVPATPPSRLVMSEPAPQVIENGSATNMQERRPIAQNQVAYNPVPMNAKREAPVAAPSERAVELLAQANTAAQSAQTEDQLTQIVQMCRQVLAIDQSQQAIDYSKNLAAWALNRRGELRADAGHDREAMLDFEDAIHTDPSLWRAVHNRGVMLAQQGQFATAFDDFNRTVELNPKFAKAYSNRAALYTQAGDLAAALDDYRQAITLDPDLAVAHKGRGRVCHIIGNFEEALQHFDAAVLLAPGDPHIALGRADLLTDMGRYAAAIEGYQRTIALDPTNHVAYRCLAWVQATCPDESFRNAEQALANAEQALYQSGQEEDITLDTLAAAQANAGNFVGAQATQVKAIGLAPAGEKSLYQERLGMYQSNQPFRTEPPQPIRQATYRR